MNRSSSDIPSRSGSSTGKALDKNLGNGPSATARLCMRALHVTNMDTLTISVRYIYGIALVSIVSTKRLIRSRLYTTLD